MLFLLNVTECINALDSEASSWSTSPTTGRRLRLTTYIFRPDLLPESSLFKIPETSRGELLTHSGLEDPADEFVSRYERAGLTGLEFDEVFER